MAEAGTLHDAFIDERRDTYDARNQRTKAPTRLAKAASNSKLRDAVERHLRETQVQIQRLEQVFESFDEWAQAMGHNEAAKLLEQTLKEEKAADEKPVARRTPSSTSDRRRHLRTTKTSAYRASDAGAWPRGGGGLEVASSPLHSGRTR